MKCNTFRSLLSPFFDDELPGRTRALVSEHVRDCPRCSQHLEDIASLRQLLKRKEQMTIMPSLWTRTAAELRAEGRPEPWFALIHTPWAAAFACIVLLITSLLFIGLAIIPNGHAKSNGLGQLTSTPTDVLGADFAFNPDHLSRDTLLSIILAEDPTPGNR